MSSSPGLRFNDSTKPSQVSPMTDFRPMAESLRIQWRYRPGFSPGSLFSYEPVTEPISTHANIHFLIKISSIPGKVKRISWNNTTIAWMVILAYSQIAQNFLRIENHFKKHSRVQTDCETLLLHWHLTLRQFRNLQNAETPFPDDIQILCSIFFIPCRPPVLQREGGFCIIGNNLT